MSRRTRTPSPVDTARPTILSVLQESNPEITDEWAGTSYKNTTSATDSFDWVRFNDTYDLSVQEWTDFNFEAIDLAYGDILHQEIKQFEPNYQPVQKLVDTNATVIINEGSVDGLGSRWSHLVVKAPLKAAATHLRQSLGGAQRKPTLEYQRIQWIRPRVQKHISLQPDWAIIENTSKICYREDKNSATPKALTYVVGDSKLSQKWKSKWLARGEADLRSVLMDPRFGTDKPPPVRMDVTEERTFPLDQVATYCRYAQTRYAFILTQTELVALRIRRIHPTIDNPTRHQAAVEYASVPWHRKTKLTVNLAIWALGCMGMNADHREMETADGKNTPLDRMARLTWWKYDAKDKVYQNVISKRKIPGSEWKKEYEKFVHLTEQAGNSFTSDFETGHNPGSSQPSTRQLPLRPGTARTANSKPPASAQPAAQAGTVVAKGTAPTSDLSTSTRPATHSGASPPASGGPTTAPKGSARRAEGSARRAEGSACRAEGVRLPPPPPLRRGRPELGPRRHRGDLVSSTTRGTRQVIRLKIRSGKSISRARNT
ncbi:hypothetical protein B0I37DRAFT_124083 [Chaetomium sp. MPI-CAGE-AT-0009]|nr:hypothetical protein B0I37DRAFT_124083 [Chaetomium sp. MPI-CAGE-AT-0009]